MKITEATMRYEHWLAQQTPLNQEDLTIKHAQMRLTAFTFLRATFFRWAQVWPKYCPHLTDAPTVLAVGDLHVENFGTWRDGEGRLIWGINDFDEACVLPYTNDLVRLAVSAHLAIEENHLHLTTMAACRAISRGYSAGLKAGGKPFVLAEQHVWLREAATSSLRDPAPFWEKMDVLPPVDSLVPASAREALEHLLPQRSLPYNLVHRVAGEGSLGRQRFTALAEWQGGNIAREAKALAPSAAEWACGSNGPWELLYTTILTRAVRCSDPFFQARGQWVVRRLAPDCSRVELSQLALIRDEGALLEAMGWETANIHLGTQSAAKKIIGHLKKCGKDWLEEAVQTMGQSVVKDWHAWQNGS